MKSIRSRLIVSYLALAAITLVVTGALLLTMTRFFGIQIQRDVVREAAGRLLPEIQSYLRSDPRTLQLDEVLRLAETVGDIEVRFVGPEGTVDVKSLMEMRMQRPVGEAMAGPLHGRPPPHPGLSRVMDRLASEDPRRILDDLQTSGREGTFRVGAPGGPGSSYLEIVDRGNLADRVTRLTAVGFSISAAVTLAASALLGLLMSSRLTRPIADLTGAVEAMAGGNLQARARVTSRDEIGQLGGSVNEMASRLSESVRSIRGERDALRSFLADASHELRTPLTAMGNFVELLQSASGEGARDELLTDLGEQVSRMAGTVNDLLALSRLDGGVASLNISRVDLPNLVVQAWRNVSATAEVERVAFALEVDKEADTGSSSGDSAGPDLMADRDQLLVLMENIFLNSVNAVGGDGRILCQIATSDLEMELRVLDNGPGVPASELKRIFDRFYRSPSNKGPGSGLGLAIVKAVAQAHGGAVRACSPPADPQTGQSHPEWRRGLEIIVVLPRSGREAHA